MTDQTSFRSISDAPIRSNQRVPSINVRYSGQCIVNVAAHRLLGNPGRISVLVSDDGRIRVEAATAEAPGSYAVSRGNTFTCSRLCRYVYENGFAFGVYRTETIDGGLEFRLRKENR